MATVVKQGEMTVIDGKVRIELTLPQLQEDGSEPLQLWRVYEHDSVDDIWRMEGEYQDYDSALAAAFNLI